MSHSISHIEQLSPVKRALLETLRNKRSGEAGARLSIAPQPRGESPIPLSFAQQRLWFIDQLEPNSSLYNLSAAARLTGRLDVRALERTVNEVVRRHELLRTTFPTDSGEPQQVVAPPPPNGIPVTDLADLSEAERESELRRHMEQEAQRPFDLSEGPLLRVTLLRLSEEEHVALFTMHHIISDGWSMGVLVRELSALYRAYSRGEESPLPELPVQYADYSVWQRRVFDGEAMEEQLSYWRERLRGLSPLELPTDRPRPPVQSFRGARRSLVLGPDLSSALRGLCRAEGVTLFMTLLAAFKALLMRYAGQDDIVVGTDIAGRDRKEIEGLIGFFVNQLVMRTDLSGDPTFRELLGRVREACLGAYAHQEAPFEKVVEAVNPERGLGHTPLFQVKLLLQNAPPVVEPSGEQELSFTRIETGSSKAAFDIVLNMVEAGEEISGLLEYATDLYDDATIGRMLGHFQTLLESAAADPDRRLSELTILTEAERALLLDEWNETAREYEREACVHHLFEEQARLNPEAPAAAFEGESLSYAELNRRANRMAHHLRSLGVRPGVIVGLCMERSLDLIVGLLGILKAGGAYLPLDPSYPKDRLAQMLSDARPSVLLTTESLESELPENGAFVVCADADAELITLRAEENFSGDVWAEHLAYVIYTSGSTGKPKGIMIPHGALVNRIEDLRGRFGLGVGHSLLHCLSFSFDAAAESFFTVLASGAALVLHRSLSTTTAGELLEECGRNDITSIVLPPSYWHHVADELARLGQDLPQRLTLLMTGGEPISTEKLAGLARRASAASRFINNYGPAEVAITCTSFETTTDADAIGRMTRLPIGRPLQNTRVYVLDEHLRPVPLGVSGEVYVGGVSLAWGYLEKPAQTAEKFLPDPFSAETGARLYRTGDRARLTPDGNLDFLGRADQQVKIRAFRIELGEIEAALGLHPGVLENVVVAREDSPGDRRLVAYFVPRPDSEADAAGLRDFLKQRVPEYMLPAAFAQLEALPLLPSGKVDRRALPAPSADAGTAGRGYVAPSTPEEEVLAAVWSQVLGVERVGIDDNFFALGGDSIRSIQVLARAEQRGLKFTVQQLFRHQTVGELAKFINLSEAGDARRPTRPFDLAPAGVRARLPEGVEDAYPLTMAQSGMIFHSEYRADIYHSIVSQHIRAKIDLGALRAALAQLIERHPMLRTSFDLSAPGEPIQLVHASVEVPLSVADIRHLSVEEQEREVRRWVEEEKGRHFDWASAPLMCFQVHLRGEETFQFSFSAPHAMLDGWSDSLLFTELLGRYVALARGETPPAEPPPVATFRDYVALERQALDSGDCRRYWDETLSGAEATRLPRTAGDGEPRTETLTVTTTPEMFQGLRELARLAAVPLKSVLLAAHLKVMSVVCGGRDVMTGMVLNGRPEENDGERIVGLFLNTLPFRMRIPRGSWIDLARETFEAERELLPFRRYPLAQIQKDAGGHPLFETYFDYTHFHVLEKMRGVEGVEVLGNVGNSATNYTLAAFFNLDVASSRIKLSLSFDLGEVSRGQAEAIRASYEQALAAMAGQPLAAHAAACLLGPQERRRLSAWNETRREWDGPRTLTQLFEAQAERTPEAVAVKFEGEQLTYRELNERAGLLARRLRAAGVGPETLVGVLSERSTGMVVALLGVLKAGGAYVPLDPSYPAERLRFMLEDSGALVLLVGEGADEALDAIGGCAARTLRIEGRSEGEGVEAASEAGVGPRNLAYVIYTSGSTGRPKAAMIEHGAIVNHMKWMLAEFPLRESDRVIQKTPFSFDASVWEFYAPLLAGARLVLARPGGHMDGAYLSRLIAGDRVTVLQVVPTLLRVLLDEPEFAACSSLRRVFCGGEPLPPELVARFRELLDCELVNLYGPTEATIDSTFRRCGAEDTSAPVPIGRPVANTSAYVLDEHLQPSPVGVTGELYVGGDGVARGYLNRPALTAERFIPDPFSAEPGSRLYRTGDLARFADDGRIEYLGRADHQVKLRGFRIELGEVESALRSHTGVCEVVVVAREDAGGQQLVAYVVAMEGAAPDARELREHLTARLPDYMIPAAFVMLTELPLAPNGKIDRRALPEPGNGTAADAPEHAEPRAPAEEMLAAIWREVLGVERVGLHDNFFESGGHSLQAIRVISRVRAAFRLDLHLRSLFEAPTLAGFAAHIERAMREGAASDEPPILPVSRAGELPLSFAQQRLWFLDQLEPGSYAYNVPAAFRLKGALDLDALERTFSEIVRRHEVLRTTFPVRDGLPVQVISPARPLKPEVTDLSGLPEPERSEQTRRLAATEATQPFDLARGPLLRLRLLRLGEEDFVALFTMHHIASDGWSTGILAREITRLYDAFSHGRPSPLPEPSIQYADFAHWQRDWLRGEALEAQLSHWRRVLRGPLPAPALSPDRPRRKGAGSAGARRSFTLTPELSAELKGLSLREDVTLFMLLLAAFKLLLFRRNGQGDVIVGTASANRNRGELEGLIGFFVNMLAIRTDLSGNPTFAELLGRVKEATLGAFAHQDLPFEKVVEELQLGRGTERSPVFQIAFGLQNTPAQESRAAEASGLSVTPLKHEHEAARYDLTVWMSEVAGRLAGSWTYDPQLFDEATIESLQRQYAALLENIARNPCARLDELDVLTEAEKKEDAARTRAQEEQKRRMLLNVKPQPVRAGGEQP